MSISMYQASVPVFVRMLTNLRAVLQKGEAHAQAKNFDPNVLLITRLFPDMFPLTRQVQIATDMAKGAAARLAGQDVPSYPDTEATFAELYARIDRTIDFLKGFKPEQVDGSEQKTITLKMRSGEHSFDGQNYLLHFALPNFYFHVTTAYALLRANGVELSKQDFMGAR